MSLFRKRKRESADLLEDSIDNRETESRSGALARSARYLRFSRDQNASNDSLFTKRLRASADVEDDGAETELINEERRGYQNE
jgi:hypothetical protein